MDYKSESGFTIIEMVIVVLIFSLIVIAVYNLMITANKSTAVSQNQAEINQKVRFYFDSISRNIRSCVELDPSNVDGEDEIKLKVDEDMDGTPDKIYKYALESSAGKSYIAYYSSTNPAAPSWGTAEKKYLLGLVEDIEYKKVGSKIRITLTLQAGQNKTEVDNLIVDEIYMKMLN